MEMTESEICRNYRLAKNKGEQLQMLAELNATSRAEIIDVLTRGGETVRIAIPTKGKPRTREMTDKEYRKALFKYMDTLDVKIAKLESEYRDVVAAIRGMEYAQGLQAPPGERRRDAD